MLETGVPVVYGYIADLHGNENIPGLSACTQRAGRAGQRRQPATSSRRSTTTGRSASFFKRLAADGITPKNTLFVLSSDEGDHEAGANVGRAVQPTPVTCDGATVTGGTVKTDVLCTYPAGTFGELDGNLNGLLATRSTTPRRSPWSRTPLRSST